MATKKTTKPAKKAVKKTAAKKPATKGSAGSASGEERSPEGEDPDGGAGAAPQAAPEAERASKPTATKKGAGKKAAGGASAAAEEIVASESASKQVQEHGAQMLDERSTTATQAARVLSEITTRKPELVVPLVDKFVAGITSEHKRVIQTSADALPQVARVAPARVARHLDKLKTAFDQANETGKDGLVRTFAALCTASVAYQKRLEPVLTKALAQAEGKMLLKWTETVLPALKGEPHARARAVVEERLHKIPRSTAQPIADFLGIKLRVR